MVTYLLRWVRELRHLPRDGDGNEALAFDALTSEIVAGLESIAFDEVTVRDRVTFVEHAVVWQVRRALAAGRFDLALALQRWGVERIETLERGRPVAFQPMLVRGNGRTQRA